MRAHREELQRVQIGLVGLAAVLLIVTLANLVIQTARDDASTDRIAIEKVPPGLLTPNASSGGTGSSSNEPLADLGVTPTADSTAPSVPDLEPDPRLREPMDRDPAQSQQR